MKNPAFNVLFILLFAVFLGVFIYSGIQLWTYYSDADEADDAYQSLLQLKQEAEATVDPTVPTVDLSHYETMSSQELAESDEIPYTGIQNPSTGETTFLLPEYEELYTLNPDLVGWITVPGTRIDYPVVQRPQERDYYLYRNFQGGDSAWGCIYVKESCDVFAPSDQVVIYGHRMLDGAMFADLAKYEEEYFWKQHPTFRFDTIRGHHEYEIVCVMRVSGKQNAYPYHAFCNAKDELDFYAFWAQCQAKAIYDTGIDVRYGDKLVSLYTCEYSQSNGRLVVIGRRIS